MARERPKRERERRSATEGNGGDASSSDVAEERGGHAQGTVLDMRLEDEGLVVDVEARDSQIEKNSKRVKIGSVTLVTYSVNTSSSLLT